jgi:hypothetical protein
VQTGRAPAALRRVAASAMSHASQLTKKRHPTHPGVVLKRRRRFEVAGAPVTTQMPGNRPSSKYTAGMVTVSSPHPGLGSVDAGFMRVA